MLAKINDEDQQSIVTNDEDQHLKAKEVNTQRQSNSTVTETCIY